MGKPASLQDTGLSGVGLGTAPIGNLYEAVTDDVARGALDAAAALGVDWFDTAPLYGFGLAERRLGEWLDRQSFKPRISTKVGRTLVPAKASVESAFASASPLAAQFDYTAGAVRDQLEASLARLRLTRFDVAFVHDPEPACHGDQVQDVIDLIISETLPALEQMKSEGLVGAVGIGLNETAPAIALVQRCSLDYLLIAGRYTLLDQSADDCGLLNLCASKDVKVFAAGVFNSGLLAGGEHFNYAKATPERIAQRDRAAEICSRHGAALGAAALQFAEAHPCISSLLVGARSEQEVREIAAWRSQELSAELWAELAEADFFDAAHSFLTNTCSKDQHCA